MDQLGDSSGGGTPSLLSAIEASTHSSQPTSQGGLVPSAPISAPPSPFALTTSPPRLSTHSTSLSRSPSSSARARSHSPAGLPLLTSTAPGQAFASRPSPVVPSPSAPGASLAGSSAGLSPSRPTSPSPRRRRDDNSAERRQSHTHSDQFLAVDDHTQQQQHAQGELLDLNHIFERDVEFNAAHSISPQEAIDVAVPPVLDEAALALTSSQSASSLALDQLLAPSDSGPSPIDAPSSGWSSPAYIPGTSAVAGPSSPTRAGRSFSPDSTASSSAAGGRATSPGSSTSFSVGTPSSSSSPPPFSLGLTDALESEARKAVLATGGPTGTVRVAAEQSPPRSPTALVAPVPFPTSISMSTLSLPPESPGRQGSASPSSSLPTPAGGGAGAGAGTGGFDSPGKEGAAGRRLSFLSYSDILNEERLSELTGSPLGGELGGPGARTPSRVPSQSQLKPTELAGALNQLSVAKDA